MKKSLIITFTLLLCAITAKAADMVKFRWGDSNKNNKVKYNNGWPYLTSENSRCYLYLGTTEVKTEIEEGKTVYKMALDDITYICDDTNRGSSLYNSFGNYQTSDAYLESDKINPNGGETYSLIVVCKGSGYATPSVGSELLPGSYYSVAIKTYTSKKKTDSKGNDYIEMVTSDVFAGDAKTYSMPVYFVKNSEPTSEGGYACGYRDGQTGYMPINTSGSTPDYVTKDNGMFYVFLGTAEIRDDGVLDFSRLTYITNALPTQSGYGKFGNYASSLHSDQLWDDDRIDPKGGQEYTILLVSKANGSKNPPVPPPQLYDYQTNMYVAVYTGTTQSKVSTDLCRYAELTVDKQIVVADYNNGTLGDNPLVPIVFYNHVEYPPESKYATINIPKSYLVERYPNMTDAELTAASIAPRTEGNKCTILDSYVLGLDPDDAQSIPTVLPVQTASTTQVQLNVSNITVNPNANADVKYGLISSASPDFSNPTVEVEPQESPALEATLPASGVKYYRAQINVKGK